MRHESTLNPYCQNVTCYWLDSVIFLLAFWLHDEHSIHIFMWFLCPYTFWRTFSLWGCTLILFHYLLKCWIMNWKKNLLKIVISIHELLKYVLSQSQIHSWRNGKSFSHHRMEKWLRNWSACQNNYVRIMNFLFRDTKSKTFFLCCLSFTDSCLFLKLNFSP